MRAAGFWIDKNYDEFLQQWIAKSPDKLALLAYRSDRPEGRRFTYAELGDSVSRAAASLKRMGIGRGDVISVQLPNWWEFAVLALAAFRVGAVVNPLMPIFREHELSYMLRLRGDEGLRRSQALPRLRPRGHGEVASKPDLPKLAHIVVVDGGGTGQLRRGAAVVRGAPSPPPAGSHRRPARRMKWPC